MKIYEVQTSHLIKKYARVSVEAENEKQAIEKARSLEWGEFEEIETHDATLWEVTKTPWYISLFFGK